MRKLNKRSRLTENTIEAYSGTGCPCDIACTCTCTCVISSNGATISSSNYSSTSSANKYTAQHTPA